MSISKPGPVSRRIERALDAIRHSDFEGALVDLFPAIDTTAQRRHPGWGVKDRIQSFVEDQQLVITYLAFGAGIGKGCCFDGVTLAQAIYKFGRTSIVHDGELDNRLQLGGPTVLIGKTWRLPESTVLAMCLAVIVAPENSDERMTKRISIELLGEDVEANDLWGAQDYVEDLIRRKVRPDALDGA